MMAVDDIDVALDMLRRWEAEVGRDGSPTSGPGTGPCAPPAGRAGALLRMLIDQPVSHEERRARMVEGIEAEFASSGAAIDPGRLAEVLAAMSVVPRHRFVDGRISSLAYLPTSLDIGAGQVISHPRQVALMTLAACVPRDGRVLDVGTGSGYQAAVLSELAREVVSVEIEEGLAASARGRLRDLGYRNVDVLVGDAVRDLPAVPSFDAIVVAAAAASLPAEFVAMLRTGGRLVVPVGRTKSEERLVVARRAETGVEVCSLGPAAFVPLTGRHRDRSVDGDGMGALPLCYGRSLSVAG
jgi:protein-L-isoaspartate(D-aspartate) O-methyltransferase